MDRTRRLDTDQERMNELEDRSEKIIGMKHRELERGK